MIGGGGISAQLERSVDDEILDEKIKNQREVLKIERETQKIIDDETRTSLEKRKNDLFEWWRDISENDRAVMNTYGFNVKTMTEASCVAELMRLYQNS